MRFAGQTYNADLLVAQDYQKNTPCPLLQKTPVNITEGLFS